MGSAKSINNKDEGVNINNCVQHTRPDYGILVYTTTAEDELAGLFDFK